VAQTPSPPILHLLQRHSPTRIRDPQSQDVEALTTGAIGCLGFGLHFSLSLLSWPIVTVVGYYNPRMASSDIGDALNDGNQCAVSKMVSNGREIVREQYHSEAFGFKE
jgi:hypothetical protein